MKNIWQDLPAPIMCLAPMEGVTDTVFRRVIAKIGRPDVFFTEFTSVDGLFSRGFDFVKQRLLFTEAERPLVAQIWGLVPQNYYKAAQLLVEMGFDGIDINMGCPDRAVIAKGACSALVNNRELARELILATKEGAQGKIPVSVKIRIGFKEIVTQEWSEFLLKQGIDALTVHGRTTKQMSKVPADWEEIAKVVAVRDHLGIATKIIGNGDVQSLEEAREKVAKYGVDGVMVGRGIFHDPWLFNPNETIHNKTIEDKIEVLLDHVRLFEQVWGKNKHFDILKRFFKIYIKEFDGAFDLRMKLMETKSREEVEKVVKEFQAVR